jgi:predicted dehydrogenase
MHVWSPRAFAAIDFGNRTTTLVRPSETLLRRQFDVERLSSEQRDHYQKQLLAEHLPQERLEFEAVDALKLELQDFVNSIRTARPPQVTGEAGRDAVALAEEILARIHTHAWDDRPDGPVGPLAAPRPRVIPAPHFDLAGAEVPVVRKEAG